MRFDKFSARSLHWANHVDRPGSFMQTTILADIQPGNPAFRDEFFGPLVSFCRVKSEDEAIARANDSHFDRGGSVGTKDEARGKRVARRVEPVDAELPFGGIEHSGCGRERGNMGIQEFVNQKLVRTEHIAAPV